MIHPTVCLHSDMVRDWPRRQAQTQAAIKKKRPLEEKVLADVRKRVSQIEKTLKPALENSSLYSNTTKEAVQRAQAVAKVGVKSAHHLGADCLRTIGEVALKSGTDILKMNCGNIQKV